MHLIVPCFIPLVSVIIIIMALQITMAQSTKQIILLIIIIITVATAIIILANPTIRAKQATGFIVFIPFPLPTITATTN